MNRTGSTILHGLLLATSGLVGSTLLASTAAMAGGGPTGGSVAVGSATITNPSATQTVVNQSSKKALINWNSFSIPGGSSVKFNQPNSKSLAVNRVTGPNASIIEGQLLANGSVWLINANGVLFGKGSQINVGALLATTSDLSDDDFKNGKYNFKPAANPNAAVVNKGTITAGANGSVVLSAPRVSNEGLIQADLGTVVLGGANAFTVDMTGDNLLRYQVTAPVTNAPKDANGSVASALVSNSGTILAAGGHVMMTARAARNVEDNVINNTGMVEATTVSSHNGVIDLDAGPDGTVNDSGTLNASGTAQGQTGGAVNVTGGTVNVADGAKIDASGDAGGGTIQIGGGLHGGGTLAHAQRTIIGKATIAADATGKGNGGTVAVWSDGQTSFAGSISAKGGAKGGNGGQVETSGHTLNVNTAARVDTSAPLGLTGDWLLDPADLLITSDTGQQVCSCGTSCVDVATVITNLATTDQTETATVSLTLDTNSDIDWNSSHSLSLLSKGDIDINSNIQNAGTGGINIIAGWDGSTLPPASLTGDGVYGNNLGTIQFNGSTAVGSAGGPTTLAASSILLGGDPAGIEQIGYDGAGGGDINVLATVQVDLSPGSGTNVIGNGNLGVSGAVTGDIVVDTGGMTLSTISGDAIIGNRGAGAVTGDIAINLSGAASLSITSGSIFIGNQGATPSGDVTFVANSLSDAGHLLEDSILSDIVNGNVLVGMKSGSLTFDGSSTPFDSEYNLSLLSGGDIALHFSLQNEGTGGINIIAGWDGSTHSFSPTMASTVYGGGVSGVGNISVASAGSDIAVGSFGGQTILAGHDIQLQSNSGNVQIGYDGAGGGEIDLLAAHNLGLTTNATNTMVRVGNGDTGTSGAVRGDINIQADAIDLSANATQTSVIIGNAGVGGVTGEINITADGALTLTQTAINSETIIGNGGLDIGTTGAVGGNITVTAGSIAMTGNVSAQANIGNRGLGAVSGNLDIETTSGDLSLTAQNNGLAAIGNRVGAVDGANLVTGSASGNIIVGSVGKLTITANDSGQARIATGFAANSTIQVNADGDISLAVIGTPASAGDGSPLPGQALIGNFGNGLAATIGGDITVTSAHGKIDLDVEENGGYIGIGNTGGTTNTTGNVSVSALDGSSGVISLTANAGVATGNSITFDATIQIGNAAGSGAVAGGVTVSSGGAISLLSEGASSVVQIGDTGVGGGDVHVTADGLLSILSGKDNGAAINSLAQIGNGGTTFTGGNVSGNITINADGVNLKGQGGTATIGNVGGAASTSQSGNITIVSTDDVHVSTAALDGLSVAQIGNWSAVGTSGGATGAIKLTVDGDLYLDANGDGSQAVIGNGGRSFRNQGVTGGNITITADSLEMSAADNASSAQSRIGARGNSTVNGDIDIETTVGGISLTAEDTDLVSIGQGVGTTSGSSTGNITVQSADTLTLLSEDTGASRIGNGQAANSTINVTAAGNITLTVSGSALPQPGSAFIGNFGNFTKPAGGNITVTSTSGSIALQGYEDGAMVLIGNKSGSTSTTGNVHVSALGGANASIVLDASNDGALVQIGNNSESGTIGGNVTVEAGGLVSVDSGGSGSVAKIGNGAPYQSGLVGGNISGDIVVTSGGDLDVSAEDSESTAQIGNGDLTSARAGNVSGDISINVTGFTDAGGSNGTAWIGNAADGEDGFTETGNVTIVTHGGNLASDFLVADLGTVDGTGGDVFVGFTANASVSFDGLGSYTSANTFTIAAGADLNIDGDITNSGSGNVNVVAGWDGHTTALGSLFNLDVANATVYGNNQGAVTIGNASVGSASGKTSVAGYAVVLDGSDGPSQIGYAGTGGGDILVLSKTDVSLEGDFISGGYAQIGNGGDHNQGNAGNSGNISVIAGGDVMLTGGEGMSYAQIGNGGAELTGPVSGDISVVARNDITFESAGGYAQIGNGGADYSGDISGNVTVSAGGSVTLTGGEGSNYLQIGNGGAEYSGNISGNVTVSAGGSVTLTGGEGSSYLQIGNGGVEGEGTVAGDITVTAGDDLEILSGSDDSAYAQIGNGGGNNAFTTNSGNIVVNVDGSITISADGGYAQIGNGGAEDLTDPSGNISVNATGAISLSGGNGDLAYAQIGNGGADVAAASSGDITVTSGGDLSLQAGTGELAYAQIGNGGDSSSGTNSGKIVVNVTGNITLAGDTDYAQIGNGGWGSAGSSGNISVSATGNISLTASDTADYGYAQIGNGGTDAVGTISGNLTVSSGGAISLAALYDGAVAEIGNMGGAGSSESGNISINTHGHTLSLAASGSGAAAHIGNWTNGNAAAAGSSGNIVIAAGAVSLSAIASGAYTDIGNGDWHFGHTGTLGGNISINATSVLLTADDAAQARIGNLGDGTTTGNIVVNTTGSVSVLAADSGLANVGGVSAKLDTNGNPIQGAGSGNLTIQSGGAVLLLAQTGGAARIESGGFTSGNVSVSATGDIILSAGSPSANVSGATAFIGSYSSGNSAVNVSVASLNGKVVLNATDTGSHVGIGTQLNGLKGNISGNVRVSAANTTNGNITVSATGSGATAVIGNAGYGSAVSGNVSVLAGNALLIAGNRQLSQSTGVATGSLAQIGNTIANFNGNSTVSGTASGNVTVTAGTIDGIEGSILNDIVGGNVTIGATKAGASVLIDDDISYSSTNALTVLIAGNVTVTGDIQNSGTGNITLVAGWNPSVAPSNVLTTSGAYGNNNATITIGGSGATGNSAVGSAGGVTTVLTKNLNITAVNGTAELGFEGVASGNIVVGATGNIAVVGKSSSIFAELGHLGIENQSVSGNITTTDAGSFTLTNGILGNIVLGDAVATGNVGLTAGSFAVSGASLLSGSSADIVLTGAGAGVGSASGALNTVVSAIAIQTNNGSAYIAAPQNSLSIGVGSHGINLGTGSLTLTSGGSITQTAAIKATAVNLSATHGAISLASAANAFGTIVLSATGSATIGDAASLTVASASVGGDLTLRSKGDLIFQKSIQLLSGALVAVAGWNGSSTSVTSGAYGNAGGSITIGGSGASGDVAIGSKSGATTLAGANINLAATNGYAQIGYHGGGSGAINVFATGGVTLAGGGSSGFFAQIGDGGYKVAGSSSEAISVIAGGNVTLAAGAGQEAYAQIGNGGAESNSSSSGYSETGLITVSGDVVTLQAGDGVGSYVQIGHGGYESGQQLQGTATLGGAIVVNAVDAIRLIGGADEAYAQIGNGGNFVNSGAANGANGTISGDIAVSVATPNSGTGNDPLTLTAGSGKDSYAQIGNGGQGENAPAAGAIVTFDISGTVTVADLTLTGSNTGANGYSQVGNGDASKTGTGNVSGQVTLGSGTVITSIPGTAPGTSAGLGNATGFGSVTGTVLPGTGIDPGTQGSVASITQNPTGPTNFSITTVVGAPDYTQYAFNTDKGTQGPTPLEQLADNSNSEGGLASDGVAESVGKSLGDGKTIYITSKTLIPGMLKQIVTLTRNNPNGIPPADEDYSSWGNEALWRW